MFFGPPPRPPGRGFWRRLRSAIFWLLLGGAGSAGATAVGADLWLKRSESIRLAAEGRTLPCRVVSYRRTPGKSPSFYVTLEVMHEGRPRRTVRQVEREEWDRVREGLEVTYFSDPDQPDRGVAQMERGYREQVGVLLLLLLGGAALAATTLAKVGRRAVEMGLLRGGTETVSRGTGSDLQLQLAPDGPTRSLRLPADPSRHVLVRPPEGPRGYVALASRTLRWSFFPELRDVPVGRLTRDEEIRCLLPEAPRATPEAWKAWLRQKYAAFRQGVWVAGGVGGVLAAILGAAGRLGDPVALFLAIPVVPGLALGLFWLRGYWRDRVLWLDGEEVHGVLLETTTRSERIVFDVSYSSRGHEFARRASVPYAWAAWLTDSPRSAPAVTRRVVLLVDPTRPARWTPVPERCRP